MSKSGTIYDSEADDYYHEALRDARATGNLVLVYTIAREQKAREQW